MLKVFSLMNPITADLPCQRIASGVPEKPAGAWFPRERVAIEQIQRADHAASVSASVVVRGWAKWHLPLDLEHTRCGRLIMRPVRLEIKPRNERHLCRHCARAVTHPPKD